MMTALLEIHSYEPQRVARDFSYPVSRKRKIPTRQLGASTSCRAYPEWTRTRSPQAPASTVMTFRTSRVPMQSRVPGSY
jgi:hypothetical protein